MPITVAFTLSAAIAICLNSLFLRQAIERVRALFALERNGGLRQVGIAFVQIWITMITVEVFMVLSGVGILSGHARPFGYLLAAIPVAHVMYGLFALYGFRSRA